MRRVRVVPLDNGKARYITTKIAAAPAAQVQVSRKPVARITAVEQKPDRVPEVIQPTLVNNQAVNHATTVVRIVKGGQAFEYRVSKSH
jgi:hypothetical protein